MSDKWERAIITGLICIVSNCTSHAISLALDRRASCIKVCTDHGDVLVQETEQCICKDKSYFVWHEGYVTEENK